ncbi:MAG: ABC transporter ATP-binding protein [Candidatus Izemoplasmatales bacterium]
MATLTFKNIKKIYTPGDPPAVVDFNLEIKDKEFVVFVGPSGCGKSTTLRMVAGLEEITEGNLYIDDVLVNDVAPKNRNIAMVFQSYALYPHMTVYNNMAFGLKLRKEPKDMIDEKVRNAAAILGLTEYLERKPKALSGGQRQRVALGRAIVRNAKVFLMDEPLSNLDAKLRVQMRGEIIKLHKKIETTTIYVTHDQIEAMTMASRIVVMKDGYIQQVGAPKDIYDYPDNVFVGGFIGTPPMNFIEGKIDEEGVFTSEGIKVQASKKHIKLLKDKNFLDKDIILGIRPEDLYDDEKSKEKYKDSVVKFTVDVAELLGSETSVFAKAGNNDVTAMIDARADIQIGDDLYLALNMEKAHFFDPETKQRIKK